MTLDLVDIHAVEPGVSGTPTSRVRHSNRWRRLSPSALGRDEIVATEKRFRSGDQLTQIGYPFNRSSACVDGGDAVEAVVIRHTRNGTPVRRGRVSVPVVRWLTWSAWVPARRVRARHGSRPASPGARLVRTLQELKQRRARRRCLPHVLVRDQEFVEIGAVERPRRSDASGLEPAASGAGYA
jgi:hypothetical protein